MSNEAANYIFLPTTFDTYRPDLAVPGTSDVPAIQEIYFGPAYEDGLFGKRGEMVPFGQILLWYGDTYRAAWFENMGEYIDAPRRIRWDPDFNADYSIPGTKLA